MSLIMVFVNSKKFACEACIKGHRSSSCSHTDRPLFEVKKKGRPVSQCEKCRELRQSKKVHSRCTCNPQAQKPPRPPGTKPSRFVPIAPALPNGIKDVIRAAPSAASSSRQRVDVLLNPCSCQNPAWKCKCRKHPSTSSSSQPLIGLATLAHAAELCCSVGPNTDSRKSTRPPSPHQSHKRAKHIHNNVPGPELPPILFSTSPSPPMDALPDFGFMPPIDEITSLAGSGCTCGVECNCPGCVEHRGSEYADTTRPNCAHGDCGTCIDNRHGPGLPSASSLDPRYTSSRMIDQFFARAAALPAPPTNRKMGVGVQLDPGNVIVYPTAAMETRERGVAFGLVTIPKLECCGGNCGCPDGSCSCGKACDGCCSEHSEQSVMAVGEIPAVRVIAAPVRSCCSK